MFYVYGNRGPSAFHRITENTAIPMKGDIHRDSGRADNGNFTGTVRTSKERKARVHPPAVRATAFPSSAKTLN